ncbi:MAG: glycosyltransferase family 4 protein [bacterium]
MSASPLRIGYVLKRYPRLSETFVLNEILALEALGAEVTILALKSPLEARFHEKLARVRGDVLYAPEVRASTTIEFLRRHAPDLDGVERAVSEMFWDAIRRGENAALDTLLPAIGFARVVRERGIEHLHAHFATAATDVAMRLSSLSGIGFSFTAHAKDIFHDDVDPARFAERLARAEFCVAVSDWSADYLARTYGAVAQRKVERIYNGLDLAEFPVAVRSGAPKAGVPLIASVGRLVPKKGYDVLLKSIALLRDSGRAIRAEIIGDGELRDELAREIDRLCLGGLVEMRGAASHAAVRDLLSRADVFALPARIAEDGNRDGLPVVVCEAMASGVPVVSTPVVGIPEAVEHGVTGMLVPENDPAALAAAIRDILEDPARARRFAASARRRIDERFDLQQSAARLHALFGAAISRGSCRAEGARPLVEGAAR